MQVSKILSALALCGPLVLANSHTALAQELGPAALPTAIAAQSLDTALSQFATQTGIQLVYVSGVVRNQRSHAVPAGLMEREALTLMLKGTGLRFEYLTPRSVRILASAASHSRDDGDSHQEVIVSASRRLENVQNVPIWIQVLTSEQLDHLDATTFDDFVGDLPGVTAHGIGPSQNNIYIRGLGTGEYANQAAGSNGSFPNVAVYLDEQPAQLPGRNLDVYAADLDRIEVLEGPQGTLFGAGAQAGVLRYITNKPELNLTAAQVKAGYAITAHGDPSTALQAVINLPLVTDQLAVRAVIYDDKRGGYIDNIPATFARENSDRSIRYANYPTGCNPFFAPACQVPPNSVTINNNSLVGNNINPVTYQGIRGELLYQFAPDWSALLSQSYQHMDAYGVFAEMSADSRGTPQPEQTVQLFNPSYDKDRFENTALTVEGRLRALEVIYAGSYLVRNVDQVQDYTNYARGGFYVDYYQCVNPGGTAASAQCFSPSATWRDHERNTHESHELRLTTPDSWRIRAVGGLFYEKFQIQDQGDWFYLTALPYFNPVAPPTGYYTFNGSIVCGCAPVGSVFVPGGVTSNNPDVRPPGDAFFNDITRGYNQKAAYASVDFELIPQSLTLTGGTRYFRMTDTTAGSIVGSFGCSRLPSNFIPGPVPDPCVNHSNLTNLNALGLAHTYSGFKSRVSLSWRVNDDALLYYTWSQGFRPGGFNRGFFVPAYSPLYPGPLPWQARADQHGGYSNSLSFGPDTLTSNEIGWKTRWLHQHLDWRGTFYQEDWDHAQIAAFDPDVIGNAGINGGNYKIRGFETSLVGRMVDGLSIEIAAAWNHSELAKEATFYWNDGTPIDFSTLQTYTGEKLANPAGTSGSPLAGAPPFQATVRARYELNIGEYHTFLQLGSEHQSHSISTTDRLGLTLQGSFLGYNLPPFTTYKGALGVGRDAWLVQLSGENLTNTRAKLYTNDSLNYVATTVARPRTVRLQFSYRYRDD